MAKIERYVYTPQPPPPPPSCIKSGYLHTKALFLQIFSLGVAIIIQSLVYRRSILQHTLDPRFQYAHTLHAIVKNFSFFQNFKVCFEMFILVYSVYRCIQPEQPPFP